jgi:hypothetical protein
MTKSKLKVAFLKRRFILCLVSSRIGNTNREAGFKMNGLIPSVGVAPVVVVAGIVLVVLIGAIFRFIQWWEGNPAVTNEDLFLTAIHEPAKFDFEIVLVGDLPRCRNSPATAFTNSSGIFWPKSISHFKKL